MARIRQARRCRARRTNGQPCKAWAIVGGYVCRVHGGSAPQVRRAAQRRAAEAQINRAAAAALERYGRHWREWQVNRVATTSIMLGIPPRDVQPVDIGYCRSLYGVPDGPETAPVVRVDRRYGPRPARRAAVKVIPADVASRFEAVISKAKASGNTVVYERTVRLLMEAVSVYAPAEAVPRKVPDPITRARARESTAAENAERQADGWHKLRADREQCTATRRDGQPCEAPAIPGGLVCRRHGGGAPQVKIAAEHRQLQLAVWMASADFQEARGTPGEFDALCKVTAAERDLGAFETKLRLLREVQAYVRSKRTQGVH